jgi:hypothetical protein
VGREAPRGRQRRRSDPVTTIASGLLPRTIQLCVHCQQRPAGFWVRRTGGMVVRRPWCLSCSQELARDHYDRNPVRRLMARGAYGAARRGRPPGTGRGSRAAPGGK